MKKQRGLLKEAQRAGDLVRAEQAAEEQGAPAAADGAPQEQPGFAPPAAGDAADMYSPGPKAGLPPLKDPPSAPPSPPSPHRPPPDTPGSEGPAPGTPAASKVSQVMPVTVRASAAENEQIAQLVRSESDRISEGESVASAAPPAFLAGKPRLRYAYDLLMAALPCLFFIVCCFVLGAIENVSYDCYNTDIFPTHADLVAASNCWTGIDSFYYSIITLSTIGYGDVTPHSVWGQVGRRLSRHLSRRPSRRLSRAAAAPAPPASPALTSPALTGVALPCCPRPAMLPCHATLPCYPALEPAPTHPPAPPRSCLRAARPPMLAHPCSPTRLALVPWRSSSPPSSSPSPSSR